MGDFSWVCSKTEPIRFIQTALNVELNHRNIAQYHLLQTLDGKELDDGLSSG